METKTENTVGDYISAEERYLYALYRKRVYALVENRSCCSSFGPHPLGRSRLSYHRAISGMLDMTLAKMTEEEASVLRAAAKRRNRKLTADIRHKLFPIDEWRDIEEGVLYYEEKTREIEEEEKKKRQEHLERLRSDREQALRESKSETRESRRRNRWRIMWLLMAIGLACIAILASSK